MEIDTPTSSHSNELREYISQYHGTGRYTRLLKIAEWHHDQESSIEAIKQCLNISKAENKLG